MYIVKLNSPYVFLNPMRGFFSSETYILTREGERDKDQNYQEKYQQEKTKRDEQDK